MVKNDELSQEIYNEIEDFLTDTRSEYAYNNIKRVAYNRGREDGYDRGWTDAKTDNILT